MNITMLDRIKQEVNKAGDTYTLNLFCCGQEKPLSGMLHSIDENFITLKISKLAMSTARWLNFYSVIDVNDVLYFTLEIDQEYVRTT